MTGAVVLRVNGEAVKSTAHLTRLVYPLEQVTLTMLLPHPRRVSVCGGCEQLLLPILQGEMVDLNLPPDAAKAAPVDTGVATNVTLPWGFGLAALAAAQGCGEGHPSALETVVLEKEADELLGVTWRRSRWGQLMVSSVRVDSAAHLAGMAACTSWRLVAAGESGGAAYGISDQGRHPRRWLPCRGGAGAARPRQGRHGG
jgi:hypothetical protein